MNNASIPKIKFTSTYNFLDKMIQFGKIGIDSTFNNIEIN